MEPLHDKRFTLLQAGGVSHCDPPRSRGGSHCDPLEDKTPASPIPFPARVSQNRTSARPVVVSGKVVGEIGADGKQARRVEVGGTNAD